MKKIVNRHLLTAVVLIVILATLTAVFAQVTRRQNAAGPDDPVIAGFKRTYAASVADAVELVTGKRGFMSHDMKVVSGGHLVGRAVDFTGQNRRRPKRPRPRFRRSTQWR
jgi:hypothetical protein